MNIAICPFPECRTVFNPCRIRRVVLPYPSFFVVQDRLYLFSNAKFLKRVYSFCPIQNHLSRRLAFLLPLACINTFRLSERFFFSRIVAKPGRINLDRFLLLQTTQMFFNMLRNDMHHMLSSPVLQKIEPRQNVNHIFRFDTRLFRYLFDRYHSFPLPNDFQNLLRPITAITDLSQIRQRTFWRTRFTVQFRQLVRKTNQKTTVAASLIRRKRQNARQIVILATLLLLRKITHNFRPTIKLLRSLDCENATHRSGFRTWCRT